MISMELYFIQSKRKQYIILRHSLYYKLQIKWSSKSKNIIRPTITFHFHIKYAHHNINKCLLYIILIITTNWGETVNNKQTIQNLTILTD